MALHSKWSSGDLIFYDGLQNILIIKDGTDGVEFGANSSGADVKFFGDTASAYMEWDASANDLLFEGGASLELDGGSITLGDTDAVNFGDDDDISIAWDTNSFDIEATAANVNAYIEFGTAAIPLRAKFFGTSGGTDTMVWSSTGSELLFSSASIELDGGNITLGDNDYIKFGDDDDVTVRWDTDSFNIVAIEAAVNADVEFGTAAIPLGVKFFGTSGGTDTMVWSSSGSELIFDSADISMGDDDEIRFGDDDDFVLSCISSGTLNIIPAAEENMINFGSTAGNKSVDMTIWGNDNTHFLVWDSSADELDVTATIEMQTTEKIQFGDTNCYINQSSGASLAIVSDGVIYLNGEIIHAAPTTVAIGDLTTLTIGTADNRFQFVNTTGAKNILLPSASGTTCIGAQFFIANTSTGSNTLSVYNGTSGEEIIAVIAQFETATLVNDGNLWRGIVATAT